MTYKEKLINLLCTVDEIKEEYTKLKFWSIVKLTFVWSDDSEYWFWSTTLIYQEKNRKQINDEIKNPSANLINIKISNPLEERHLRIFAESKWYAFAIWSTWKLIWNRNEEWSYVEIQLDNTKSFDNQSEKVWEKILNYLTE